MTTNSYFEYFLTLLGWVINNGLWNILIGTGLFAAPLAFKIVGIWMKVREEGEDEGNKGMLSLPRIENALYGGFFVMLACCVPLINLSLSTMQYDTSRAKTCGTWTPLSPDESGYSSVVSSLNDQTAAVPFWWAVVHRLSKGVTQAAVATIPCRPDLRQVRFEVQRTNISNPALAEELQDFTNDCYALALYTWKQQDQGATTDKDVLKDIEWLGSSTFRSRYYGELNSKMPRSNFPWSDARDSGRPNTGRGGYPTCNEWWSTADTGLQDRVVNQADPGMWLRLSAALKMMGKSTADYKEAVIRRLVSPQSLNISQGGQVYAGYGGNADFTTMNTVNRFGAIAGGALGSLGAFPAFDAMRQALPMVQAILLMATYVMLPLILAFGVYEFKVVITLTFVIFALNFLTFWWELARWLDSWLLEALYSSDTHSRFNLAGFQNTSDDMVMSFVMGTMFIVLPTVWIGALSWAGVNIGNVMSNAIGTGVSKAQSSAEQAGSAASKGISSFAGGVNEGLK
ncbi:conjugal transfer protein TraG N-terminal domain-containing protein [Pectobacterium peruviense]|uniref:Conjugal transfer protein TraG n=1 Tax=Pectobacterium peruviense TaxID=2066479 RepID=A0ABX4S8Z7_9GAMM|nr:conjugal transfer protein TraG N-terminal domain-containing protein [Pectobacterium peruviense]KML70035.1 membrane protein [Pectobacterium peruviense]PKX82797.1 conjugal transfer protein TraG [Pectobacterium peruviense]PKX87023.1 conjugal transfer protein TraG [Pectobacterium peruviense]